MIDNTSGPVGGAHANSKQAGFLERVVRDRLPEPVRINIVIGMAQHASKLTQIGEVRCRIFLVEQVAVNGNGGSAANLDQYSGLRGPDQRAL